MTKIFIEGYELDLSKGLSNQITYAVDDLNNLDSKATTFSKTIVLPGSTTNNYLLGNIFEFNSANFTIDEAPNVMYNFNASKAAVCRIEVDGLQIVKGVFRLLEIIRDGENIEFEVAIFGELGGLVTALGNKRIEDLDFSAYNHNYTYANITASWSATFGSGYVYPLIDYGNVSVGNHGVAKKDFQYKTFRPALFLKEYFDKMIAAAGYTYSSTFFNTAFFKRLIIPNNSKQLSTLSTTALNVSNSTAQSYNDVPYDPSYFVSLTFPTQTTLGSFTTSNNYTFKYTGAVTLSGLLKLKLTNVFYQNLNNSLTIYIKNKTQNTIIATYLFTNEDDITLPELIIENNAVLNQNDEIECQLFFDNTFQFFISWDTTQLTLNATSLIPVPLNLGEAIKMNDTIPRGIFQKDLFTSTLKLFNLMAIEDKFIEKHLIIEPYVDFYTGTILDWSDKLDRSKPIRMKPMSEATARYYELKWKQDNDFYNEDYRKKYNEGYGDRIFDNGLDFAKDKETVEVIFAASPLYGKTGEDKVYPAIYKKSNNNTAEDPIEHVVRLMQIKHMTGDYAVSSWKIYNDNVNLGSNTTYLYAGHLDNPDLPNADLNFGATKELFFDLAAGNLSNNLFNVYYSPYLSEITDKDSRLLTANFKLTQQDIFNLDFSKFIYIDGGLYRLSKVIDYTPENNEVTKCELLRVINKTY
jgi:hypothetical protein